MNEVGFLVAFAAGVLALLSPCSALLLPSFFAYSFASPRAQLARTGMFYAGLLVTLVPLGMGVQAAATLFYGHRQLVITVSGWLIIGLGVLQVLGRGFAFPFADRLHEVSARVGRGGGRRSGWVSTFVLGAAYGLAGFCSGPVLGAILTMAATSNSAVLGGVLLAVYALGMAAPLFVLAAVWDRFDLGKRRWLRGRTVSMGPVQVHTTSLVAGLLFIGVGVMFLVFDGTAGVLGVFGDTTGFELTAQERLMEWFGGVPLWVVPAAVAVIAVGVAVRRALSQVSGTNGHG